MKTFAIISGLALAARAVASNAFGGLSIDSGSPIQYGSINANGTNFYIGRSTATDCPTISGLTCSNQTNTLFTGGNTTLYLHTEVPGGQEVYVDSTGALRYTVPHSAYTGVGSVSTGFSIADEGLHLKFQNSDFLACPLADGAYEIYAAAKNTNSTCLGFEFRIADAPGAAPAWEYL